MLVNLSGIDLDMMNDRKPFVYGKCVYKIESIEHQISKSGKPSLWIKLALKDVEGNKKTNVYTSVWLSGKAAFGFSALLSSLGYSEEERRKVVENGEFDISLLINATGYCISKIVNDEFGAKIFYENEMKGILSEKKRSIFEKMGAKMFLGNEITFIRREPKNDPNSKEFVQYEIKSSQETVQQMATRVRAEVYGSYTHAGNAQASKLYGTNNQTDDDLPF